MLHRRKALLSFYGIVLLGMVICIYMGNQTVSVLAEQMPVERKTVFVIDPGHGGVDGGATSCTGMLESAFNLEIGLRLNDLLLFLGYDTTMIRTDDRSVYTEGTTIAQKKVSDLKERLRICNETAGAILLSIHQNYFSDSRYSGPQVFYAKSDGSEALAKSTQSLLQESLSPKNRRGIKRAEGIYLMEHVRCPGILIECGFLSNPEEEARLRSEAYQKRLCCVLAVAAVSYANT